MIHEFYINFQITNGYSKLSQELANYLRTVYNCQTFLIATNDHSSKRLKVDTNQPLIYECNTLKPNDLQQFTKVITQNNTDQIDVLIENNCHMDPVPCAVEANANCDEFIRTTSETIQSTLNVGLCVLKQMSI